jgi:histidyl-tRNA synthetase
MSVHQEVQRMLTQRPRGTNDVLPGEQFGIWDSARWQRLEEEIRAIAHLYGYQELRPPIFEHTELMHHSVGETSDIVTKQMFNIMPRGDDPDAARWTLRPEFTAGMVRAWIEHGLYNAPQPTKIFAYGPAFRYENVQKGRYRQLHQFDIEVFGSQDPAVDAEVIELGINLVGRLGLKGLSVDLNSIGCPVCRPAYRERLIAHVKPHLQELCGDCNERLERNPLRLLDCKADAAHPAVRSAPVILEYLCAECDTHFRRLQDHLQALGVSYQINAAIVRGLDYYTKTVFEIIAPKGLGSQSTMWAGGRYDGLIEALGGKPTPGVGFGMGMERVLLTLEAFDVEVAERPRLDVFIATLGEAARPAGLRLLYDLRAAGLSADLDYLGRSLKAQLKYAGKLAARYVAILGEDELRNGAVALRAMDAGAQESVPLAGLVRYLQAAAPARRPEKE